MVKLELSDNALLTIGGLGHLALGAHALAAPDNFSDVTLGPRSLHPVRANPPRELVRCHGHSLAALGALALVARDTLTPTGTRRFFQTSGVIDGTAAAMAAVNAYRGKERKGPAWGKAAAFGTLGALKLWRGFKRSNTSVKV